MRHIETLTQDQKRLHWREEWKRKIARMSPDERSAYYKRRHATKNREKMLAYSKAHNKAYFQTEAGKRKRVEARKRWRKKNPQKMRQYIKKWALKNKDVFFKKQVEYKRRRYNSDPMFATASICRSHVSKALKRVGAKKSKRTLKYLDCSLDDLKFHIESQFLPGMSWGNRGEWEIDHITPVSSAKTQEELLGLLRYSNLQPLWAPDNRKKAAKLNWNKEAA